MEHLAEKALQENVDVPTLRKWIKATTSAFYALMKEGGQENRDETLKKLAETLNRYEIIDSNEMPASVPST